MDELTLDGKIFISSKRAAKITGYARDYVGQLCREGHVEARLVGRNWYVLETSIREHRFGSEKPLQIPKEEVVEEKKPLKSAVSTWEAPKYAAETTTILPEIDRNKAINLITPEKAAPVVEDPVAQMQAAWQDWFSRKQVKLLENEPAEILLESPDVIDGRAEEIELKRVADSLEQEKVPTYVAETPKIASYEPEKVVEEPVMLKKVADTIEHKREEARSSFDIAAKGNHFRRNKPKNKPAYLEPATFTPVNRTMRSTNSVDITREPKMDRKTRIKLARQKEKEQRKAQGSSVLLRLLILLVAAIAIGTALVGTGYLDQFTSHYVTRSTLLQDLVGERLVNKSQ